MKSAIWMFFVILSIGLVSGCGDKKAGIEGKVVDGKGQPMSGLKVIAKQVQPIKGYEQFGTTTGSDGTFKFKGLFPASEYAISLLSDKWETSTMATVKSAPEGQTSMLPSPMTVRFTVSSDGIIADSQFGIEWVSPPDQPMTWVQAQAYAQSLALGGGGWRLPTRTELKSIYNKAMKGGADPAFRINVKWVWTGEARDATWAWNFYFSDGDANWSPRDDSYAKGHVLVVRSAK